MRVFNHKTCFNQSFYARLVLARLKGRGIGSSNNAFYGRRISPRHLSSIALRLHREGTGGWWAGERMSHLPGGFMTCPTPRQSWLLSGSRARPYSMAERRLNEHTTYFYIYRPLRHQSLTGCIYELPYATLNLALIRE